MADSDDVGPPRVREGVRLQKVLSQAGIASRRVAERMIIDGRVEIDGQVVTELGTRVDIDASEIRVDGARVILDESLVYLALNKPQGMHSTMSDDRGRPCIGDHSRENRCPPSISASQWTSTPWRSAESRVLISPCCGSRTDRRRRWA